MWKEVRQGSRRLIHSGKFFFLSLAVGVVWTVAGQCDSDGVLFTRKAMIRCGMALNVNDIWEEWQLSPQLQNIVAKYRDNFNRQPVTDHDLDVEVTDLDKDS